MLGESASGQGFFLHSGCQPPDPSEQYVQRSDCPSTDSMSAWLSCLSTSDARGVLSLVSSIGASSGLHLILDKRCPHSFIRASSHSFLKKMSKQLHHIFCGQKMSTQCDSLCETDPPLPLSGCARAKHHKRCSKWNNVTLDQSHPSSPTLPHNLEHYMRELHFFFRVQDVGLFPGLRV